MRTVARPDVVKQLVARLERLRPDSQRRWGTMTPNEMLCHLGDAAASILADHSRRAAPARPFIKWIALSVPLPWPRGIKTPASVDPRRGGTRPVDFEHDRERAIETLRALASAPPAALAPTHLIFGSMSARDWHRWAYRHTDHHLRQFYL